MEITVVAGSLGAGVIRSCAPPNVSPLQEQWALLTAQPSLQPFHSLFITRLSGWRKNLRIEEIFYFTPFPESFCLLGLCLPVVSADIVIVSVIGSMRSSWGQIQDYLELTLTVTSQWTSSYAFHLCGSSRSRITNALASGMVVHTYHSSPWEAEVEDIVNSRPAWAT